MWINIKSLPLILVTLALVVPLPLIFIVNGPLWLDVNFIFWFILFYALGISAYSLLKRLTLEATIPYLLVIGALFVFLIDVSIRRGDEWVRYVWLVFSLAIAFISVFFLISATLPMTKKYANRDTFWKKHRKNTAFRIAIILLSIFLVSNITLFFFPIAVNPLIQWKAENNEVLLNKITSELTQNQFSLEGKAHAIWEWFNPIKQNMFNTWRPPAFHNRFDNTVYCSLLGEFPYFLLCVRRTVDVSPLWILTSRCGNCGEYAALYSEIAHSANLTVRTIQPFEMDHTWDEVLIDKNNETWIIVDPSRYKFDVDPHSYKNESGNFSYVFAQYSGSSDEIDVTRNYTEVAYVNISTVDIYGKPVSNVSINLISHNDNGGRTGRNFKTNEMGYINVEIGVGKVSFDCSVNINNTTLLNSTKIITLYEEENYNLSIVMEQEQEIIQPSTSFNLLQDVYFTIFLIFVLGLLDQYLTIKGHQIYRKKYADYVEYERYELNPQWRNLEQSKYNPKHLLFLVLIAVMVFIIHSINLNLFFVFQGFFISLFLIILTRHLTGIVIFSEVNKNPNLLSGKIRQTYLYRLKISIVEMIGLLIILLVIFIFVPSYFTFGVVLGPLLLIIQLFLWRKKS